MGWYTDYEIVITSTRPFNTAKFKQCLEEGNFADIEQRMNYRFDTWMGVGNMYCQLMSDHSEDNIVYRLGTQLKRGTRKGLLFLIEALKAFSPDIVALDGQFPGEEMDQGLYVNRISYRREPDITLTRQT